MLPLLNRFAGDTTVHHHWIEDPIHLHLFKHKGYWYHGRRRETGSMQRFAEIVRPGDFVIEVGAHIGYIAMYFARLVGPQGRLIAFEPSPDNLRYLERNLRAYPWASMAALAVCDRTGTALLYVENLTGQNSSLLPAFDVLEENAREAYVPLVKRVIEVECTTLDEYLERHDLPVPSFVKIDVEGAEYRVLQGMKRVLSMEGVALMVEVTERCAEVCSTLVDARYRLFSPDGVPVESSALARTDLFCFKPEDERLSRFLRR